MTQYNLGVSIKYLPEDDSKIVTHFEPEEVRKLIQATDRPDWRLAILLAAETGLRLSDIVAMEIESIKFARGCLVVSPKKQMRARSKKTVTIPLSGSTVKKIQSFTTSNKGFLFPDLLPHSPDLT